MSFLGRRRPHRHRDSPHADLGALLEDDTASLQAPSLLQPSIRSTSNIRKRLSHFTLLASSLKRGRSQTSQPPQAGVGFAAPFRLRSRSRSPSPEPSLEIRRPSGLGRRASVVDLLLEHPEEERREGVYGSSERKRSISTPELSMLPNGLLQWSHRPEKERVRAGTPSPPVRLPPPPPAPVPVFARMPADLLKMVLSFAAPADLASAALVCKMFLEPARALLYEDIDLAQAVSGRRTEKCINLLASRRNLGIFVHGFTCDAVPSANEPSSRPTYSVVTFAIALNNMPSLSSLTLPRFDTALLSYTSFRLRKLTFLCERMTNDDIRSMFEWLDNQSSLTSLSLPKMVLDDSSSELLSGSSSQHQADPINPHPDALALPLSPHLLPELAELCGPASLVALLTPGRPLTSLTLHIHSTIYDGLRPSALISALAQSSSAITRLAVVATSHGKIDARTTERLLMSVGSELGSKIQVLKVDSTLEDEVLRKLVGPVLPRYKVLHALYLHRKAFPLPFTPPPTPSPFRLSPSCAPSPSVSPSQDCIPASSAPPLRTQERAVLAAWSRHCASLRTVVFPSSAEWSISPATAHEGASFTLKGVGSATPGNENITTSTELTA